MGRENNFGGPFNNNNLNTTVGLFSTHVDKSSPLSPFSAVLNKRPSLADMSNIPNLFLRKDAENSLFKPKIHYFIDRDPAKGLDLGQETFQEVDRYIDARLETFIIKAKERNKQLFEEKPYLKDMLIKRFNIPPEEVSEDRLLEALTEHMVVDKPTPYQDKEKGVYYLPYDDIHPNDKAFKNRRFNWDTEMHLAAVLNSKLENKMELAKNSLRNAAYLFDVLGYVPNAAARGLDDCTQPSRHTTMIRMIWNKLSPEERQTPENKQFFDQMWDFAKREYWEVFNAKDPANPYSSKDPLHQSVEKDGELFTIHGSIDEATYHGVSARGGGWDHSKRAYRREADHSRIDTEMYSLEYEEDFVWRAKQEEDQQENHFWKARRKKRADRITDSNYYYDPKTNWFYDYDFKNNQRSKVATATGIFALRLLQEPEQKMDMLQRFEEKFLHEFGVGLTDPETLPQLTAEKVIAIETMESDPGMQTTIKEEYNHEQWEGDTQFFNITKQVKDSLVKAAKAEADPRVKKKIELVIGKVMVNTLIGLVQYYEKSKQLSKAQPPQGKIPEKIHTKTGEMAIGAQYGDQDELAMGFGAFKEFSSDYTERQYPSFEHIVYEDSRFVTV